MSGLLGIPTLIIGLILRYADNPQWFSGAHTVGHILIIVSVIVIAISLVFLLLILLAAAAGATSKRRW